MEDSRGEISVVTKVERLLTRVRAVAGPTFRRFWASVAISVALTVALIEATTVRFSGERQLASRLSLALLAGLLASWCVTLFWERRVRSRGEAPSGGNQVAGNLAALLLASAVSGATFFMLGGLTFVSVSRHIALCALLALMFLVIPNAGKSRSFEMYVVSLFTRAVLSVLFAGVMFVGLAGITATLSGLFSLAVPPEFYARIAIVMFGTVAPFVFMAGIPEPEGSFDEGSYPKTLSVLVLYAVAPLLTAYSLILFAYFAKILVTWEWPVGLVGHLVLWYALLGTASLYFVWPLASKDRWASVFPKYFTIASIPLLLMMFGSVGIRIRAYGITENRYYVLVVGLWLLASMLYLNLSKTRKSLALPVSLALVVMLSVTGPWSSFSVSKWSQNGRLESLCAKYGMIGDGSIVPSSEVSQADREEIRAIVRYFQRYHDLSDVRALPEGFTVDRFEEVFGFGYVEGEPERPRWLHYVGDEHSLDIGGASYHLFCFVRASVRAGGDTVELSRDDVAVVYDRLDHRIRVLRARSPVWELSLADFASKLQSEHSPRESADVLVDNLVVEAEAGGLSIRLMIMSMSVTVDPVSGEAEVHEAEFVVLVGKP